MQEIHHIIERIPVHIIPHGLPELHLIQFVQLCEAVLSLQRYSSSHITSKYMFEFLLIGAGYFLLLLNQCSAVLAKVTSPRRQKVGVL